MRSSDKARNDFRCENAQELSDEELDEVVGGAPVLVVRKQGGGQQDYFTVKLNDVIVSG